MEEESAVERAVAQHNRSLHIVTVLGQFRPAIDHIQQYGQRPVDPKVRCLQRFSCDVLI